jgi:putative nucleotidyltransferase with HDIG domain
MLLTAALAAALGLAFFSIWAGVTTAFMIVCLALMFTAWRLNRTLRKERMAQQRHDEEMRLKYESIISTLGGALGLLDNLTGRQSQRVSHLAGILAWQMGLRKEQMRQIEKASILHDIGKVNIPETILSRAATLDERQWTEMKKHPELGYRSLSTIGFLRDVADVVHAHHERYDGAGYPRGLAGNEIPLGARIFALVEAYCAMTADRPYRKALSHLAAVEEIMRNSGSQFDPQVVQAFLQAEKRGLIQKDTGRDGDEEPLEAVAANNA